MSWAGFKKNVGRATTQVMVKTGRVEKTADRDYEVEERRYRTLESAALRLQKEAKGYLDSLRAMTASQMRIAETVDAFYGDSGARDGVSRSYKQAVEDLDAETVKALDGPYRTTVLEPINRFCAYFPDINECIKKRNHKMLDYDSMRSKVKKLVEKPDKDPGKLPRTEKETEMVMTASEFFRDSSIFDSPSNHNTMHEEEEDTLERLVSPPKILDKIKRLNPRWSQIEAEEEAAMRSVGLGGNDFSGISRTISTRRRLSHRLSSLLGGSTPGQSPSDEISDELKFMARARTPIAREDKPRPSSASSPASASSNSAETIRPTSHKRTHSAVVNKRLRRHVQDSPTRRASMPQGVSSTNLGLSNISDIHPALRKKKDTAAKLDSVPRVLFNPPLHTFPSPPRPSSTSHSLISTPFFHPSELEDIMAPLRKEFIERKADLCLKAKAAYEQLNNQLTEELPQLIDLRVPYLDPTFEALVKIQLRFCAEAYSRMAQVQQYLDPATRDQYASGDLDARVEDVLGQIRELSIAGTV
ncbi:unnamed protein product [Zymoseptoria tritici ST99CH_3D1]|uniref:BAR domain-containing protein n=1 Tax=Zymoseptoria tritici ST99CH_1E4 TaxID=1276532 RepID=A0A2H1GTH8_ZYMTR|nr:unnamed protein product [Zymoseptoria tritici ST99CH_1E4]SMR59717.1 unnamed protein product [Zymoseptoria tritici ST99CH_3D1]